MAVAVEPAAVARALYDSLVGRCAPMARKTSSTR